MLSRRHHYPLDRARYGIEPMAVRGGPHAPVARGIIGREVVTIEPQRPVDTLRNGIGTLERRRNVEQHGFAAVKFDKIDERVQFRQYTVAPRRTARYVSQTDC